MFLNFPPPQRRRPLPRGGLALALLATGWLSACASLQETPATPPVPELVQQHGGPAAADWQPPAGVDAASARQRLLEQPLDADAAQRLALLNNPTLQAALAGLDVSAAQRQQMALWPNPTLGLGRVLQGQQVEIERLLRLDLWSLVSLPWRLQWQDRQLALARLQTAQEVLRLSAEVRRAWVRAVAAEQSAHYLAQVQEAAEAAVELGQSMVRAGNWSRLQQAREQLVLAEIQAQLARSRLQAQASREQLVRLLGLDSSTGLRLPEQLPAPPHHLEPQDDYEAQALRERLDVRAAQDEYGATAAQLGFTRVSGYVSALELGLGYNTVTEPGLRESKRTLELAVPLPIFDHGQARQAGAQARLRQSQARVREVAVLARSEARTRWQAWQSAWTLARHYDQEVLPLRRQVSDETLLRYNGMLVSVWELLAETRASLQAMSAAIEARRDFWLADTELRLALNGTSSGNTAGSPSIAAPRGEAAPLTQGH